MRHLLSARFRSNQPPPLSSEASDVELVAGHRRDPQAFGILFDRYFDDVFRYCYYHIGDWHQAEDAASQVFLSALSSMDRFDAQGREDSFRSWLFGIARHVVGKSYRYTARHPSEQLDTVNELPDAAQSVEGAVLDAERLNELHHLFTRLTNDQQDVLELRLAGLSAVEIAKMLGRTQESVRKAQSRAMFALKGLLRDDANMTIENHHG